ncbi:MAG: type I secretion system permease/ATPase [Rhodobacteraceae bacterium]|nr:MAG: type I secretion system permease/ATPase [Paracoccaceae bacterium]
MHENPLMKSKNLIIAVAVFSAFVNLLMLTGPLFMLQVYDRVLGSRSVETLTGLFILVVLLYSLMGVLDYARGRVMARVGAKVQSAFDAPVFNAVLKQSVHEEFRAQPARGLRDIEAVQALLTSPVAMAVFDIPWTPLFIAAIFIFHPSLGWLAVFGGLALLATAVLNQFLTRKRVEQSQITSAKSHRLAEDARQAAEIINSQGMRKAITQRWKTIRNESLQAAIHTSDFVGIFTSFTKSFRLLLQSAMLAVGAYYVLQNELSAGAMIAGSILMGRALAPIEIAIGQWPNVLRARSGWQQIQKIIGAIPETPTVMHRSKPKAHLVVKNLVIVPAGQRKPTLAGLSFEVKPGEALGVLGKSGSGKSTLARALIGLTPPASGEIRLDGEALANYDPDILGTYIGYLPQSVTLFDATIAQNIARMAEQPDAEQVKKAVIMVQADRLVKSLPDSFDTVIHNGTGRLSGGEKQRIGLARALYGEPALLVLDEPNAALDSEGSIALNLAIKKLKAQGHAVVLMTHRPTAIQECDKLLYIDAGRQQAYGPRDDVLKSIVKNAKDVNTAIKQGSDT